MKMKTAKIEQAVYEAAHQSAIFVDRSNLGMLKISGESRLELIHRMSTQDVKNLKSGEGAATILTTDIGRMIDRLILYAANDSVYALTGENHSDAIARYLMRFVFFNDDFQLQDISSETTIFGVYGPWAEHILGEEAGFPEVTIPLHHWREAEIGDITAYLHKTDPINGSGYFVMCEGTHGEKLREILLTSGILNADETTFDLLRIEAGQPRFGHEITTDYIPLEAGLWDDVSFKKGCYTGQEIIARLESRGRLAKQLVCLASDSAIVEGEIISASGKQAGSITSAARVAGGTLALGYVKSSILGDNSPLFVGDRALEIVHTESEFQI
jgi:folate-binding protein YgfZ